jgi:mannosyltransferase OCH1-like enzyme
MKKLINNTNKSGIPKIIHQIWLGPRDPPLDWMASWKDGFCKKYNWKYILWRDKDIKKLNLRNIVVFNNATSWQQKSDIARYEVLYKYGGIYLDVDMIWLKTNLNLYLNLETSHFIGVQEHFSRNLQYIGKPFISNGFIAVSKNNTIIKNCIQKLPKRINLSKKAFITTGPGLLNSCINIDITVIPTDWVFPVNFTGFKTADEKAFMKKGLIFTKSGFEMPYMKKGNFLETAERYLERLVYV